MSQHIKDLIAISIASVAITIALMLISTGKLVKTKSEMQRLGGMDVGEVSTYSINFHSGEARD
jgi:hypothetical protein